MEEINYSSFIINDSPVQTIRDEKITNFNLADSTWKANDLSTKSLVFFQCKFEGDFKLKIESIIGEISQFEIKFIDCDIISLSQIEIRNKNQNFILQIHFDNCIVKFFSILSNCNQILIIQECFFLSFYNASKIFLCEIQDSIGNINISNTDYNNNSSIDVKYNRPNGNLYHIGSTIYSKIEEYQFQHNCKISELNIYNFHSVLFNPNLEIKNTGVNSFYEISTTITFSHEIKSKIEIFNHKFQKLKISGKTNESKILLESITFRNLILESLSIDELRFYNVESLDKNGCIMFDEVNYKVGKLELTSLENVSDFYVNKTSFEHLEIIASLLPSKVNFINDDSKNNYKLAYEFYRQLKTSFLRNNNTLQALEAHSKMFEYAMKRDDLNEWDKLILKLNHFSNRNGTSIAHAIKTIGMILFSSYLLLVLLSAKSTNYCPSEWFRINIYNKLNLLFYLLNPLFKIEDIKQFLGSKNMTFLIHFILFMTRIGIGWGFYQFVAAFRKFGKN